VDDCPRCRLNQRLAQEARAIADAMLVPVNALTRLPPGTVQGFVEGTTTGAVEAAKAPKGKKRPHMPAHTRKPSNGKPRNTKKPREVGRLTDSSERSRPLTRKSHNSGGSASENLHA